VLKYYLMVGYVNLYALNVQNHVMSDISRFGIKGIGIFFLHLPPDPVTKPFSRNRNHSPVINIYLNFSPWIR